ncbi:MAG: hypothetical protein LAO79_11250 [Acidobacteriia bacterium]|nr:hypothetical protein [Terriglobia bacterium]
MKWIGLAALAMAPFVHAMEAYTIYDLLPPATHSFDILYDVSSSREGAAYFFNPIRIGSVSTKESVIDLFTGKPLQFEEVDAAVARQSGLVRGKIPDNQRYIRVKFLNPVPKNGEVRIRIVKTYTDPPSYYERDDTLIFDRPLGIKRNIVILPKGYELIASGSPAQVSTDADGRVRVSFLNDRDDQLPVKIVGRKVK